MIVDSSAVVAIVVGSRTDDSWVHEMTKDHSLAAPHHVYAEVANALRRGVVGGVVSREEASMGFAELLELDVELYPFEPFAGRVWELRDNISPHDAWYVALAEALDEPLITLDLRLARATGPICEFLTPPDFG